MFRSKLMTFLFLCLATRPVFADDHLLNLSYWNWGENFQIMKDDVVQDSNSNFSALGLEYEFSSGAKSFGWNASAAALMGQATGGDANGTLIYIASYQKFVGGAVKVNAFWRIERRIYLEAGPLFLFRSFQWPASSDGLTAQSGASFNYGAAMSLRIRLHKDIDFCQTFGTLLVKGSSLWSAGFGYRF